jgi:hypothetical protein
VSGKKLAESGPYIGQFLAFVSLILVYGVGAFWLCQELISDAEFARTADPEEKVPMFIRFGVPTMIIGISILFFRCSSSASKPPRPTNTLMSKFKYE